MPAKKKSLRKAPKAATRWVRADGERTVLITGANRGLGLEFVRQYMKRGYRIIAAARRPGEAKALKALAKGYPKISLVPLDVTKKTSVDALAGKLRGTPIDILINNAGLIGEAEKEVWGAMPYAHFNIVMETNVKGPMMISEAFIDHVAASTEKKIVVVSSVEASLAADRGFARPFYRASKAAVNMMMRNVAAAVKERGVMVGLVCPGGTDTDMTAFLRGIYQMRSVDVAVSDMIRLIDNLTPARSAISYNYDDTVMPW